MLNGKLKQFRKLDVGELFFVAVDCAQGGADNNIGQFLSRKKIDVPLVYENRGVASTMTPDIFAILEMIYDVTKVAPWVAFERNMGGASEMDRLNSMNINKKFRIWNMPIFGKENEKKMSDGQRQEHSNKLGWDTTSQSRPVLVGDLKNAVDSRAITIYEQETIDELYSFIISNSGKPEAEYNAHDDRIIPLGICWQMFQRITPDIQKKADYSQYENHKQEIYYNPLG